MHRFTDSVKTKLFDEQGNFLAFEWSVFFYISIILISILLPDIFTIGRQTFYTHQAASYGIMKVAENGRMTEAIANDVEEYLKDRNIHAYAIYGSRPDVINDMGDDVEVIIATQISPMILRIMPDMRMSNSIAVVDGVVQITAKKIDVSSVYVRN